MISTWIHQLLTTISSNPGLGYIFSFLMSFLEALPIVGTIIPGSITMTAVGTLIGTGALPIFPTFFSAIIGAFLGDFTGFLFGRLGEERLFKIWPFNKHRNWLNTGRKFFKNHGGKSVVIGRFIGPLRSAIPMVASLLGMSYSRFIAAGLCSATLWSLLYIMPGYLLGKYSSHMTHKELAHYITITLISFAILTIIYIGYKCIIYYYKKYYQNKVNLYWQSILQKNKVINFFANKQQPGNSLPLLLLIWLVFLIIVCGFWLSCRPFMSASIANIYPSVSNYIQGNHYLLSINHLTCFNMSAAFLIIAAGLTAITSIGIRKALSSWSIYILLLIINYLLFHSDDYKLSVLIFENMLLWLPLAFCAFTKTTIYTNKLTATYFSYGVITIIVNGNTATLLNISFYTWILSYLITAIFISLFSLLSFRLTNPINNKYLDSMVIHMPYLILLFTAAIFF